ncbi:MAG: OmpA family protein [Crocinitomicaceae bacterium]|nr:OmpA family protein [Crocinitomicaceae bacterium]MBK8926481.1 OmpA family protein [Crocinitomicaceae bacterium]
MKNWMVFSLLLVLISCVPIKKYRELEANYNRCMEEQSVYKSKAIDYENQLKEISLKLEQLKADLDEIVADTTLLGEQYRALKTDYQKIAETNQALEEKYTQMVSNGNAENAKLINELEATRVELQKKEDLLNELEKELNARARALDEKEKRINELEQIIASKDEAVRILKEKIAAALRGFADRGITVEEKDGRIYVRMAAQLLFASGKTEVSKDGQTALIDLAHVLETQKDIDILVEGHTDVDPMNSSTSPKDNWELSVLRATSVVKIMLSNSNMDPTSITAGGRSEYIPVDPNDKSKNRRIEIIITPDLSKLFELISSDE